ncbi:phosphatase PAP2 family protein [Nocardioides pocheonensis]|uniref:Phosphatase PAP2 family protein n=1 Tax=Nocardioides pocheonensis TaxID=661485 RepID=A0A3N0GV43_9ACTN|nr:phosphatase PAP2 family protein [Nocardioides pocheonensis]RNM16317.1 phosphatase PAP2 family protein [Nocardioides pocheonensis]
MSETETEPRTEAAPPTTGVGRLRVVRRLAFVAYLGALAFTFGTQGAPLDREGVVLWVVLGLAVASIGRRPIRILWLVLDFLPFVLVLVFYDYLRGLADTVGMPTWWRPQIEVDRFLFFGHVPTVWLQEHLKHQRYSGVRWYDLIACLSYYSFFFLPYLTAGVMWLRSRADFYRWAVRFVALSFSCFLLFMLIPTAPPWAAGHCTAADVADHPSSAPCMYAIGVPPADGLLGRFTTVQAGANPWVERIAGDGLQQLHLGVAHELWTKGFSTADPVAAVPSLHLGGTVLFCLFLWRRTSTTWRPLLVLYPLVMMFSLAYTGEHYVADGIAGALAAWLVHTAANRLERWRERRRVRTDPAATPAESASVSI